MGMHPDDSSLVPPGLPYVERGLMLPSPVSAPPAVAVSAPTPAFVFVVDVCSPEEELRALLNEILHVVANLPENSLVGLVSFGSMVWVHGLGYTACSRVVLFSGDRELSSVKLELVTKELEPAIPRQHSSVSCVKEEAALGTSSRSPSRREKMYKIWIEVITAVFGVMETHKATCRDPDCPHDERPPGGPRTAGRVAGLVAYLTSMRGELAILAQAFRFLAR
ncbi:hypothetical protein KSP39_PZI019628 [Platanthera zijinensis]|uniref:Protein transport protein SEC23 n=1 Tax=Platanthera zijinensis TaxID=2320716 RepID=A0AAP0B140_9ASPA